MSCPLKSFFHSSAENSQFLYGNTKTYQTLLLEQLGGIFVKSDWTRSLNHEISQKVLTTVLVRLCHSFIYYFFNEVKQKSS